MSVSNTQARIAQRDSGSFTLADVAEYVQEKAKPGTKVYALMPGRWTKVGGYQLFLKSVSGDMDDAWINVIVRPHNTWLSWLILSFSQYAESEVVTWWHKIPGTNLLLDVWYVGDGSGGTALVFEAK